MMLRLRQGSSRLSGFQDDGGYSGVVDLDDFGLAAGATVVLSAVEALDAGDGAVDDLCEVVAVIRGAVLPEALLGLLGREPGGFAVVFLGAREACNFAEVGVDDDFDVAGVAAIARLDAHVAGEGGFFDASMNAGFLEGFERGSLCVGQPGFDAALGKRPAATAGAHQQKFDAMLAEPVADGGDLLRSAQLAQVFEANEGRWRLGRAACLDAEARVSEVHEVRVPERAGV